MCHVSCIVFVAQCLHRDPSLVAEKRVLEIGAYGMGVRPLIELYGPAEYVGVDFRPGPGVDIVADATRLDEGITGRGYDLVVTTETLEHVRDWRAAVEGFKRACRPGGALLLTTRSAGYPFHGAPDDYWRFDASDMRAIFSDFELLANQPDEESPGIFVLARRPGTLATPAVPNLPIYSIAYGRRISETCHPPVPAWRKAGLRAHAMTRELLLRTRRMLSSGA
jgi:SAM-dependent methyltransferase